MTSRATCGGCKWWERYSETTSSGRCHLNPKAEDNGEFYWCSHHSAREERREEVESFASPGKTRGNWSRPRRGT